MSEFRTQLVRTKPTSDKVHLLMFLRHFRVFDITTIIIQSLKQALRTLSVCLFQFDVDL